MAISISRLLICFPALSLALLTPVSAQTAPQHPLDGLTSAEYWAVHDILHKSGHMTPDTGISTLLLHEPLKSTVLAWKPGDPVEREADVILEDKGQTIEARVDITGGKLESWNVMPGVQAPFTTTELHAFSDMIKSDPRVQAAFQKRGLTDMNLIYFGV
jgi:primary-amine oxidase